MTQPEDTNHELDAELWDFFNAQSIPPYERKPYIEPKACVAESCIKRCPMLEQKLGTLTLEAIDHPTLAKILICTGQEDLGDECKAQEYNNGYIPSGPFIGEITKLYGNHVAVNRIIGDALLQGAKIFTRPQLLQYRADHSSETDNT